MLSLLQPVAAKNFKFGYSKIQDAKQNDCFIPILTSYIHLVIHLNTIDSKNNGYSMDIIAYQVGPPLVQRGR
jgi:hypothetical protein